jgi:hypothetical protein
MRVTDTNYAGRTDEDSIINIRIWADNSRLRQVTKQTHVGAQGMDTRSTVRASVLEPSLGPS